MAYVSLDNRVPPAPRPKAPNPPPLPPPPPPPPLSVNDCNCRFCRTEEEGEEEIPERSLTSSPSSSMTSSSSPSWWSRRVLVTSSPAKVSPMVDLKRVRLWKTNGHAQGRGNGNVTCEQWKELRLWDKRKKVERHESAMIRYFIQIAKMKPREESKCAQTPNNFKKKLITNPAELIFIIFIHISVFVCSFIHSFSYTWPNPAASTPTQSPIPSAARLRRLGRIWWARSGAAAPVAPNICVAWCNFKNHENKLHSFMSV